MVMRVLLTLLLGLQASAAWTATIQAHIDRNPVLLNESFVLTFDAQGDLDEAPDFSPLEALFDILNHSQSTQLQLINGRMDQTKRWQLTLMARAAGNYTIPAIAFGEDRSNTLPVTVKADTGKAPAGNGPILLEAELTPEQAYVQSQLVYTVRLLRSVNLRSGNLSEPKISGVEAMVEKLGDDRSFETLRDGVRYVVVERSFAIFPQQSGTLTVEPTVFQGQIIRGNRFTFNESMHTKRLTTQAFSMEIQAIPEQAQRPWLPTPELQLVEQWPQDPPRFHAGEPVTRTLTLKAGGIAAAQLPALSSALPDGLKQYADQPRLEDQTAADGLTGLRQEKIAIMPSRAGRYELPAIEIPWWNTRTGQQQVARIPARTIEVAAASDAAPAPAPAPAEPGPADTATPALPAAQRTFPGIWPWLSLVLALGWSATLWLWWRQQRKPETPAPESKPTPGLRAVKRACNRNDAGACKSALLDWAKGHWPEQPPTSLGAIATRVDSEFAAAIEALNRALYGQHNETWNGTALQHTAQHWLKSNPHQVSRRTSPIAPLHPERSTPV